MATRIPTAVARKEIATILKRSARGERIKVTRHDKTIAVLIPKHDLDALEDCEEEQKEDCEEDRKAAPAPRSKRSSGSR